MVERCKYCGANLAMVGIRHRCIGPDLQLGAITRIVERVPNPPRQEYVDSAAAKGKFDRVAYHREYMREYMRKRRKGKGQFPK